jgi:hypothetical protein
MALRTWRMQVKPAQYPQQCIADHLIQRLML